MAVNTLEMTCQKCKVASTCPKYGASPLKTPKMRKPLFCHIQGVFGRVPIDPARLSEESKVRSAKDGPCATFAVVPVIDEASQMLVHENVVIFSPPNLHPRETVPWNVNLMYPKSPT